MTIAEDLAAKLIRLACGVRPMPEETLPAGPSIFFANHSSHLDFALIWAALPPTQRRRTRPVAGRDYWEKTAFRRWLAGRCFRAVLIERQKVTVATNPLEPMLAALDSGASLIVFPEGTRSLDGNMQPFKAGLYHMARARPTLPLVPVWLDNLNRILPKGEFLVVPLIASVSAGGSLQLDPGESKKDFLVRTQKPWARCNGPERALKMVRHSERSEESTLSPACCPWILRRAQNDRRWFAARSNTSKFACTLIAKLC